MRLCGMLNSWWTGWSRSSRKSGGGHGGGSKRMVFRLADFKDWNAGLVLPNGARRHYRQDARRNGAAINVVKFPYNACRRVHSRKPRISKNGTPEERAAKAAAPSTTATVVQMQRRTVKPHTRPSAEEMAEFRALLDQLPPSELPAFAAMVRSIVEKP